MSVDKQSPQKVSIPVKFRDMLCHWLDSDYNRIENPRELAEKVDWERCIPFIILHLGLIFLIWVGWSPTAVIAAALLYVLRMFAITGFYHRYFSHRTGTIISTQTLKRTSTHQSLKVSGGLTSAGSLVNEISLRTTTKSKI